MLSEIDFRILKVHVFGSIFNLKLSLRLKTVLSSNTKLKRYCKATLNDFLIKKNFDDDIKFLSI